MSFFDWLFLAYAFASCVWNFTVQKRIDKLEFDARRRRREGA